MKSVIGSLIGLLIFVTVPFPAAAHIVSGLRGMTKASKAALEAGERVSVQLPKVSVAGVGNATRGACRRSLNSQKTGFVAGADTESLAVSLQRKVSRAVRRAVLPRQEILTGGAVTSLKTTETGSGSIQFNGVNNGGKLQRTLVLIKPDAIEQRISGVILDRLDKLGLQLVGSKVVSATEEIIREHYKHLAGTPFVDGVVAYMLGKYNNVPNQKIYAFVFQGENAIAKVRAEIGATNPEKADPNSIRGMYGHTVNGVIQNCVHASGAPDEAEQEIALWFKPGEVLDF